MKPRIVIAAAWITSLVLASAGGAVATETITGRSVENGSLTGADVKNSTLAPADLAPTVREDLREPVVVRVEVPEAERVTNTVGTVDVECPAGMVAVNGGLEQLFDADDAPTGYSDFPHGGGWRSLYLSDDASIPVRAFAVCV